METLNYKNMEISVKELNELLEKEFERGKRSVKKENTVDWTKTLIDCIPTEYIPAACKTCSNHPSNGGSGICNCVLPDEIIY